MSLDFTPSPEPARTNVYAVDIEYEMGDSDFCWRSTHWLSRDSSEIERLIGAMHDLAQHERYNWTREQLGVVENLGVSPTPDPVYSGQYCNMIISSVHWYDASGNRFLVTQRE